MFLPLWKHHCCFHTLYVSVHAWLMRWWSYFSMIMRHQSMLKKTLTTLGVMYGFAMLKYVTATIHMMKKSGIENDGLRFYNIVVMLWVYIWPIFAKLKYLTALCVQKLSLCFSTIDHHFMHRFSSVHDEVSSVNCVVPNGGCSSVFSKYFSYSHLLKV